MAPIPDKPACSRKVPRRQIHGFTESAVGHTRGCVICSRTGEELPSTQKGSQRGPHSGFEDRSLRDGSRVLEEASW